MKKQINEIKRMQQLAGLITEGEYQESLMNEVEVDMKGKKCEKCKKGTYEETNQMDDLKGVLHCTKCGDEIERYADKSKANENDN